MYNRDAYKIVELVALVHDIDSLSMRVTDFLLNDNDKKNGFLENFWFLSLHQRMTINQYCLFDLVNQLD